MTRKKLSILGRNQVLGIAILAVGALAVLIMGYLAYQKLSPSDDAGQVVTQKREKTTPNRAAGEKPNEESYKSQKTITEQELKGAWETNLSKGTALLEMKKGKYRLIVIPSKTSRHRSYSNGTYKIQDNVIILEPDLNVAAPVTKGHKYNVLTRSKMPMEADKYKGKLIWQKPPEDLDMYVPPYNAILEQGQNHIVVWRELE